MPDVYADGVIAGAIESRLGETAFAYNPVWLKSPAGFPLSLSMPLSAREWGPDVILPWLMNLLPEGAPLRALTRALGASAQDVLALITASGGDLAGALSIRAPAGPARTQLIRDEAALERILNELPARPFLVGEQGVAMSLAGAQEKLPVVFESGAFYIPVNGSASTHILKPDTANLPGSVQNEALCMQLARRCGLNVAEVATGTAGDRSYLLVTRYDRVRKDGAVRRIHQEDFCQALGRPPGAKYEHNHTGIPGPSLAEMFALIREHMTARDINRFLDAVIFNIAIGNVDSHAKNYSILLQPGRVELAPLYDLMSGLAWANITENHAQSVGGQRRGRYVFRRHWQRLGEAAGLSAPALLRRVVSLCDRIAAELPGAREDVIAMPAGKGVLLDTFCTEIAARVTTVRFNAGTDEPDDRPDMPEGVDLQEG